MNENKIRIAQIRGDGLGDRETKAWEYFPKDFEQTVFFAKKNVYHQSKLPFQTVTLPTSSDNFLFKNFYKYFFGQYKRMFGLEKHLQNFDIAHAGEIYNYYTYQAVAAKKLNKKLKVVAVVWENSFGRFEYNYWPGFKTPPLYWRRKLREIISANAQGVDKFLPASRDAAELLLDFGVPEKNIEVVVPGIIPAPAGGQPLPPQLAGKEIYLMVSRLVKEKGVYDVLYAWRMYLRKADNPEKKIFVSISTGPEKENMLRIIKEWGMEDKFLFIDQVPYSEILNYYKAAKCLVLNSIPNPTWQEQFGYVLAESISAGTPVISTYCGAIPETVGQAGILVTPANPVALRDALLRLDDPIIYENLKNDCEIEMKKFAIEEYARKMAGIYRSLI